MSPPCWSRPAVRCVPDDPLWAGLQWTRVCSLPPSLAQTPARRSLCWGTTVQPRTQPWTTIFMPAMTLNQSLADCGQSEHKNQQKHFEHSLKSWTEFTLNYVAPSWTWTSWSRSVERPWLYRGRLWLVKPCSAHRPTTQWRHSHANAYETVQHRLAVVCSNLSFPEVITQFSHQQLHDKVPKIHICLLYTSDAADE